MKYKLGIFGSSAGDMEQVLPKARILGEVLRNHSNELILMTGACAGVPYEVLSKAAPGGIEIWGFSPSLNREDQLKNNPDDDLSMYSKLVYVPAEFPFADTRRACMKYRNVISTATCDAAIVISGRWGSLNELTNLLDMQKVVGVLTDTGGIADELPELSKKISKEGQGELIFESDPQKLVEKLLKALSTKTA